MPNTERDYKQELYESYRAERKDINGTALAISDRYDKAILYIGGGALAVSVTFIEKIAPSPSGWSVWLLGASWFTLVAGILSHLFSLAYSQKAIRRQMEILDSDYGRFLYSDAPEAEIQKEGAPIRNRYSEWTGYLSQASIILVVFGVAALCAFTIVSVIQKPTNHERKQEAGTSAAASASPAPNATATAHQGK